MTQAEKETILSLRQKQCSLLVISKTTGLPIGTIKSFLSRASRKIKEQAKVDLITTETLGRCRQCGALLKQERRGRAKTFCSDRCRTAYWNEHRDLSQRPSAHLQKCEMCGRDFYTYRGRYCSRACFGQARSRKAGVARG